MPVILRRSSTLEARFVRLKGQEERCLLACPGGEVPEELVIDFGPESGEPQEFEGKRPRSGRVTYRLQPSSLAEGDLLYVEVFDE